ncbi:tripartite motif-containing protein 35-like [Kryptolebias marmoratus]|nr:tripartite motif-containing protein 35-like [Kryptolebias marmoratus]
MAYRPEEDLHCPICMETYRDPVILPCSHSFCRVCLQNWWMEKNIRECPLCKEVSSEKDVLCNLALKNLCETFSSQKAPSSRADGADLCHLHGQKLKLFCLQHQEPVCVICRDSETHSSHRFKPINEAAQQQKKQLQDTLRTLQDRMKGFHQFKVKFHQTAEHIKVQTRLTGIHIKEEFKKLHRFLEEEEKLRLAALMKEEQQKSQLMKDKMEVLKTDMLTLLDTIKATEEALRASDVWVLLKNRTAVDQVKRCSLLDDPQLLPGALIDQAKHLGNLGFNIWTKMKDKVTFTPVILDPNTASPELILSEDLTAVRCGRKRQLPENPERIQGFCSVLGSEGFSFGTHSWEVSVEKQGRWELGVLQDSAQTGGDLWSRLWRIQLCDGKHRAISPPRTSVLLQVQNLQRIQVNLDMNKDSVSFLDADTNEHIYTFTQAFTGRVFPYIWTGSELPFRILPVPINVFTL